MTLADVVVIAAGAVSAAGLTWFFFQRVGRVCRIHRLRDRERVQLCTRRGVEEVDVSRKGRFASWW
jgi:hypothetical protein